MSQQIESISNLQPNDYICIKCKQLLSSESILDHKSHYNEVIFKERYLFLLDNFQYVSLASEKNEQVNFFNSVNNSIQNLDILIKQMNCFWPWMQTAIKISKQASNNITCDQIIEIAQQMEYDSDTNELNFKQKDSEYELICENLKERFLRMQMLQFSKRIIFHTNNQSDNDLQQCIYDNNGINPYLQQTHFNGQLDDQNRISTVMNNINKKVFQENFQTCLSQNSLNKNNNSNGGSITMKQENNVQQKQNQQIFNSDEQAKIIVSNKTADIKKTDSYNGNENQIKTSIAQNLQAQDDQEFSRKEQNNNMKKIHEDTFANQNVKEPINQQTQQFSVKVTQHSQEENFNQQKQQLDISNNHLQSNEDTNQLTTYNDEESELQRQKRQLNRQKRKLLQREKLKFLYNDRQEIAKDIYSGQYTIYEVMSKHNISQNLAENIKNEFKTSIFARKYKEMAKQSQCNLNNRRNRINPFQYKEINQRNRFESSQTQLQSAEQIEYNSQSMKQENKVEMQSNNENEDQLSISSNDSNQKCLLKQKISLKQLQTKQKIFSNEKQKSMQNIEIELEDEKNQLKEVEAKNDNQKEKKECEQINQNLNENQDQHANENDSDNLKKNQDKEEKHGINQEQEQESKQMSEYSLSSEIEDEQEDQDEESEDEQDNTSNEQEDDDENENDNEEKDSDFVLQTQQRNNKNNNNKVKPLTRNQYKKTVQNKNYNQHNYRYVKQTKNNLESDGKQYLKQRKRGRKCQKLKKTNEKKTERKTKRQMQEYEEEDAYQEEYQEQQQQEKQQYQNKQVVMHRLNKKKQKQIKKEQFELNKLKYQQFLAENQDQIMSMYSQHHQFKKMMDKRRTKQQLEFENFYENPKNFQLSVQDFNHTSSNRTDAKEILSNNKNNSNSEANEIESNENNSEAENKRLFHHKNQGNQVLQHSNEQFHSNDEMPLFFKCYQKQKDKKNWAYVNQPEIRFEIASYALNHSLQQAKEKYNLSYSSVYKYTKELEELIKQQKKQNQHVQIAIQSLIDNNSRNQQNSSSDKNQEKYPQQFEEEDIQECQKNYEQINAQNYKNNIYDIKNGNYQENSEEFNNQQNIKLSAEKDSGKKFNQMIKLSASKEHFDVNNDFAQYSEDDSSSSCDSSSFVSDSKSNDFFKP